MINALTVDVEDWYQAIETIPYEKWDNFEDRVERNVERLLEIFKESNVKATFFILGWIAERHPSMVTAIKLGGHEIGTHGYSHRFLYNLGPTQFRVELQRSIKILEDITGVRITVHRASSWTITRDTSWALDVLLETGIICDSSITPVHTYLNGYSGFPNEPFAIRTNGKRDLIEFPLTTIKFFNKHLPVCGGFFTRLYPYWAIRFLINNINNKGKPLMFYIHPWDIDVNQPKLKLPLKLRRHYLNLRSTEKKLKALLQEFKFSTIKDVLIKHGVVYDK